MQSYTGIKLLNSNFSHRSPGESEWPLRVIIVGHNPSEKAWELGHYYGNPSNRMWKLLSAAGIVPPNFTASNDDDCPITCGVGFTDVVCIRVLMRGRVQQQPQQAFD